MTFLDQIPVWLNEYRTAHDPSETEIGHQFKVEKNSSERSSLNIFLFRRYGNYRSNTKMKILS